MKYSTFAKSINVRLFLSRASLGISFMQILCLTDQVTYTVVFANLSEMKADVLQSVFQGFQVKSLCFFVEKFCRGPLPFVPPVFRQVMSIEIVFFHIFFHQNFFVFRNLFITFFRLLIHVSFYIAVGYSPYSSIPVKTLQNYKNCFIIFRPYL